MSNKNINIIYLVIVSGNSRYTESKHHTLRIDELYQYNRKPWFFVQYRLFGAYTINQCNSYSLDVLLPNIIDTEQNI